MIGVSVFVLSAGVVGVPRDAVSFRTRSILVPPAILHRMPPCLADKTVSRKVLGRFGIGLAFAFAFAFAFLVFAFVLCLLCPLPLCLSPLLCTFLAFAFASLVAFAFLTFSSFTQH